MGTYNDVKTGSEIIRTFESDVNEDELVWHRDQKDRSVVVLEGSEWFFQRDNEMPINLSVGDSIFIPAGEYHRILKTDNSTRLKVKITES